MINELLLQTARIVGIFHSFRERVLVREYVSNCKIKLDPFNHFCSAFHSSNVKLNAYEGAFLFFFILTLFFCYALATRIEINNCK